MTLNQLLVRPVETPLARNALALLLRVALAAPFFMSGRTKVVEGTWLTISDTTFMLFENDYSAVPLPPHFAAVAATLAETFLPILLALGLGTRLAALGLFIMTLTIQLFVYPDAFWSVHLSWFALATAVLLLGPGQWSLDRLFTRSPSP
jgi:putative oxidoreductase